MSNWSHGTHTPLTPSRRGWQPRFYFRVGLLVGVLAGLTAWGIAELLR